MGRKKKSEKSEERYTFQGTGLDRKEKYWANKQFDTYRETYHITSSADLSLLEELVYREALQERYKNKIAELQEELKKNKAKGSSSKTEVAPKSLTYALDENLKQILMLRDKLGMYEDKKEKDVFEHIRTLQKKFKLHLTKKNQASRQFSCPFCKKMLILKIRTDIYDAQKNPWFKDKVLANEALWKIYEQGRITKKEMADILGVTEDYVVWLAKKIFRSKE